MKLYHYTFNHKMPAILSSGRLMPSRTPTEPGERNLVWFSAAPLWEPTAARAMSDGTLFTLDEHIEVIGLVRFVSTLPKRDNLVPLRKAQRQAGMPERVLDSLIATGVQQGANPNHWYGSVKPVPIKNLGFQYMDPEVRGWFDADPKDFASGELRNGGRGISARMSQLK